MKVLQKRVGKISCSKFFFLQISMEVQQALENRSSDLFSQYLWKQFKIFKINPFFIFSHTEWVGLFGLIKVYHS